MRLSKPMKLMRSLLVLFIGVGLLSMILQMIVMEKLHHESLENFQESSETSAIKHHSPRVLQCIKIGELCPIITLISIQR